ncbi:hypothetical protein [Caenispirillum bisanense]|uniref:Uncharacterized protein n=1 Tax=Caenispirillum bisanense TaxID=414052 RepID=A0A286GKJ3_9PROT|nr:hypothetical protein [Caenispirillum bisanense]SOD95504.1 hypothetical protein SAMN05421508_104362 [Caenispirillum bisanense]
MFTFAIPASPASTAGRGGSTAGSLGTALGRTLLTGCAPSLPATPSASPDITLIKVEVNIGTGR